MSANITDKFGRASSPTDYAPATTVKTARTPGESVLAGYDLSKFDDDTPAFFITYKKTTDPQDPLKVIITNQTAWKGIVNKDTNTFTNLQLAPGYVDVGQSQNDYIEAIPTSFWANSLVDGLLVSHNPDGTLKLNQAMVQAINDATTPLATRREYFGTKATFDADPARFGWLFMEKDVAYTKATYQRLYDHLVAVDAASVKDAAGLTFKFADKFFGTVGVSLDATQTEFDTLGKNGGHKLLQSHTHTYRWGYANVGAGGISVMLPAGWDGTRQTDGAGGGDGQNLQPYRTTSFIIKV